MAKWVCTVCGYVYEGEQAPEACPVCKAPASKFQKQEGELSWAAEHGVGVAKGVSEDILADLTNYITGIGYDCDGNSSDKFNKYWPADPQNFLFLQNVTGLSDTSTITALPFLSK